MMPAALKGKTGRLVGTGVDKRIWWMVMAIGFFGFLIVKEISLPSYIVVVVGAIGLLGLLMTGLQNPEIPLYVLVAYIPFSRLLVGDFGTQMTALNMTNILCLWVFIAYALRQASRGQPVFQGTPLNRVIILFSLLGAASLLRASWAYGSWYIWREIIPLKQWLTPMVFYFLTLWVVRDKPTLKTVAVVIMAAVTVVALMAIRDYMYVNDSSFEESRVGGIVEHSNTLGAFFVYYMFLFLGFFLVFPKKLKVWMLLIPFLLCFRGIMVTFSRGAYIACAFGAVAACWFRNKGWLLAAVIFGVFAIANPWLLPSGIRYRMQGITTGPRDTFRDTPLEQNLEASSSIRIRIWKGAIQMIKEHPVWGVGYGAFPNFISRYTQGTIGEMDAHNSYLLIGAEMGIPTLLVFLIMLLTVMYYTFWLYRHATDLSTQAIALGFLAGLAGLMVANMFGSRMDSQEAAGYFYVLCGLIMRGVVIERQQLAPTKRRRI